MARDESSTKARRSPRIYSNKRGRVAREELLRALQFAVFEKGWRGATIREIARRAGVSVSTVHHHFASRDEIARSMYDEACAFVDVLVQDLAPAELEVLFRSVVEASLVHLVGLGEAYVDAFGQSVRVQRPLPTLWLVFDRLVKLATDVNPSGRRGVVWLLEQAHRTIVEWQLVERSDKAALAAAARIGRTLAALSWTNAVVELNQLVDAARPPVAEIVGTPWHDRDIRRMLTLGLPSRNPRRKSESTRRRPT